jgi:hypothetical protein
VSDFSSRANGSGVFLPIGPQDTGFCQLKGIKEKYQYWLAVDAVSCELFSSPNSLLTGKNTGNFVSSVEAILR